MSLLMVENLSHSFGEKDLYKSASFALNKGEHMGVVGQNGSGKSTLIKILLGEIVPTSGRVIWEGRARLGSIDQHAALNPNWTIADYLRSAFAELYAAERALHEAYALMAERHDKKLLAKAARLQEMLESGGFYAIESEIARVASGLGLTALGLERTVDTLSGGQQTKILLARLLLSRPDALLLDEPTNFLDAEHIAWLTEYLTAYPGSFMIVSHDYRFLDRVTDCICDIEFQAIQKYHGKYSDFVRQKGQRREDYARRYRAQQKETEKLEDYIAKNKARASTAKMAKSREKALARMEKLPPPSTLPPPRIAFPGESLSVSRALEVEHLAVGYHAPLLPALSFRAGGGEKVVITGFNGIGKSTLLKTLTGRIPALGGRFSFAAPVRVGYFEQDLRWADPARTPLEIVRGAHPRLTDKQTRQALARCGVHAQQAMRPIVSLSGGEQNKTKLCLLILGGGNFLILDEPTNHLDAETKDALRQAIADFEGSVLLVCHEKKFYEDFADRVIDLARHAKGR